MHTYHWVSGTKEDDHGLIICTVIVLIMDSYYICHGHLSLKKMCGILS